MKSGKVGTGEFRALGNNLIKISYAPVKVRSYFPVNSSDFTRGVTQKTEMVFILALAETESGVKKSFQSSIDTDASKTVNISIVLLSIIIVLSTILIVYIAIRVTELMTQPILQLLEAVKGINRCVTRWSVPNSGCNDITLCSSSEKYVLSVLIKPTSMHVSNDDIDKLSDYKGSCREVECAYKTIEVLYKVVQFANSAFFSGDLEVAYPVLRDALRLFSRLNNKKAIAVASNNLGIMMLTIHRTMTASGGQEICGLSKKEVIEKGMAYFARSIKLGEEAYDKFYDEQGWSEVCLSFSYYFNRRSLACRLKPISHDVV